MDAVQACEVHPVRALGLPVHRPGVAPEHVTDGGPQLLPPLQPLEPRYIQLSQLGLGSTGKYYNNKTKYFRLRLYYEVSKRAYRDLLQT